MSRFRAVSLRLSFHVVADELAAMLIRTGGRLVERARYYWLMLAEGHLTRRLFGAIVRRLATLSVPAG